MVSTELKLLERHDLELQPSDLLPVLDTVEVIENDWVIPFSDASLEPKHISEPWIHFLEESTKGYEIVKRLFEESVLKPDVSAIASFNTLNKRLNDIPIDERFAIVESSLKTFSDFVEGKELEPEDREKTETLVRAFYHF